MAKKSYRVGNVRGTASVPRKPPTPTSNSSIPGFPGLTGSTRPFLQIPEASPNAVPGVAGGTAAAQAQAVPDIRDATYWRRLGQLENQYAVESGAISAESQHDRLALARTQVLLGENLVNERLGSTRGANRAGLFYGSTFSNQLRDIELGYQRKREGAEGEFAARESGRAFKLRGLEANLPMQKEGLLEEAGTRQITRDTAYGVPTPPPAPSVVSGASGLGQKIATSRSSNYKGVPWRDSKGREGILHIYPDGRRVFVRGAVK